MFAALNSFQVGGKPTLVSDVFSTSLYTGTQATQTITNGIDLSTKGGLVWLKWRSGTNAFGHALYDTVRGSTKQLVSNSLAAQTTENRVSSFNNNGFTLTNDTETNYLNDNYVSWTFRKQPLFFDIVTWTGNGTTQTINHNLGSVPGCIMVKQYASNSTQWAVFHRSNGSNGALCLNDTSAFSPGDFWFNAIDPTSTTFTVGGSGETNQSGQSFIAYIFAHNAGGFGTGADNAISCGSYSGGSGTVNINIGYEPQFILKKKVSGTGNWIICDKSRGMTSGSTAKNLFANTTGIETSSTDTDGYIYATSTGFSDDNSVSGQTYIYVAIKAS
ncbi:hypothetical protein UFOVP308_27 [uncultured Caudovirales phage]|uniref:DUF7483 domain-containing protein n=1 Tax=uncultured Caudovirales phage TaxID=2100421 RepID=A0A6J5LU89_9CAUD|nr:hypothetical protein UFOVP308_27 [uncultured Caudovirales phage]